MIAIEILRLAPDRVLKLGLFNTTPGPKIMGKKAKNRILKKCGAVRIRGDQPVKINQFDPDIRGMLEKRTYTCCNKYGFLKFVWRDAYSKSGP
jgi:hypothetical protein